MAKEHVKLLLECKDDLCRDIVFDDISALLIQNGVLTINEYRDIQKQPVDSHKTTILLEHVQKQSYSIFQKFVGCLWRDYEWLAEKLDKRPTPCGEDEPDLAPRSSSDTFMILQNLINAQLKSQKCTNNDCNCKGLCTEEAELIEQENDRSHVVRELKKGAKRTSNGEVIYSPSATDKSVATNSRLNEAITDEIINLVRRNALVVKDWTTLAHSMGLTEKVSNIRVKVLLHDENLHMCVVYLLRAWLEEYPKSATLMNLLKHLRANGFNLAADKLVTRFSS